MYTKSDLLCRMVRICRKCFTTHDVPELNLFTPVRNCVVIGAGSVVEEVVEL
jgi:hypothetical protein